MCGKLKERKIILNHIEESKQKKLIRKLIRENVDLSITDETPDTMTYDIYYNKRLAGNITISPISNTLGENTIEIIDLKLNDDYTTINIANQAVKSLWGVNKEIQRFIISVPDNSEFFWEKLGFKRLNDTYHMLMRGH